MYLVKNRLVLLCCFVVVICILSSCGGRGVIVKHPNPDKMMHFSELAAVGENQNLNNYVLYVNEGDSIPLKISMDTEFMAFKEDKIHFLAKQKLYFMIKMPESLTEEEIQRLNSLKAENFAEMSKAERNALFEKYMLYISKDAKEWAPLYGSRAYREVLGFSKGTVSLGLMAGKENGLGGSLEVQTIK